MLISEVEIRVGKLVMSDVTSVVKAVDETVVFIVLSSVILVVAVVSELGKALAEVDKSPILLLATSKVVGSD